MIKDKYINYDLCASCSDPCCNHMPGEMTPEDVQRFAEEDDLPKALRKLFATGKFSIDWWEGDPRANCDELSQAYYIRPRAQGDNGLYNASWGGTCTFLTQTGCILDESKRPSTCLLLEPKLNRKCVLHNGGKHECALKWIPYTHLLTAF